MKVEGWNNIGYVCPYVPRRHVPEINDTELNITGNRKVNRKVTIDLSIDGEIEYLNLDGTEIIIRKLNSAGEITEEPEENFVCMDTEASDWNHRELLFKEGGYYKISSVTYSNDGIDSYQAEEIITVASDQAPVAMLQLELADEANQGANYAENHEFVRNSEGISNLKVTDASVSEIGDEIVYREYKLYYDENQNGEYEETEQILVKPENEIFDESDAEDNLTKLLLNLEQVGNYKITQSIRESYTDTIEKLLREEDYLTAETSVEFKIVNQAPVSSMSVRKSKLADIIFTIGNVDRELLNRYSDLTERVKEQLEELGIEANVSTVSTSALTATDTFAWSEYDHYNYKDKYLPTLEKHIIYEGKDIQMLGYSERACRDFLYIADNSSDKKIFEFDLQRDSTDWHSMEGGGFLVNTYVSEEDNLITGYCVLVTKDGLSLLRLNNLNLTKFRNGSISLLKTKSSLLQNFSIGDLYVDHHLKVIIEGEVLTVYDGSQVIVDEFVLPDDGIDAYGYGPVTAHKSHACKQQSYFTFKNIVMQTINGESLSDVVNNHAWTPGENHYVVNFSQTSVPELSDTDRMSEVTAALLSNQASFYGIGNDNTIDEYYALLNSVDGMGENIQLSVQNSEENEETDSEQKNDDISIDTALDQIVSRIVADINNKDYEIYDVISSDEKVSYTGTYFDPDGDEKGEEIWNYEYDASVFYENSDETEIELQTLVLSEPITMFANTGAYTITHKVSDKLGAYDAENIYSLWSNEDDYKKLILSQHRPVAEVTVNLSQAENDASTCLVNVRYNSYDEDHMTDDKKGIRKEEFFYKEVGDTDWTEGRFPTSVLMGNTYLIKYVVTDLEGTVSRPCVVAVKTKDAREYVELEDNNPPSVMLIVSDETVEVGDKFYVEASAEDDYGIVEFEIKHEEDSIGITYGRFECVATEAGEYVVTVTATDIGGNVTTESKTVTIIDNTDITAPTIKVTSPVNGTIAGNTDIVGKIKDDKKLSHYEVRRTRIVTSEDANINDNSDVEPVVIASGTEEIMDGTIATIETESLEEGMYRFEIIAEDMAGNTGTLSCILTITRDKTDRILPEAAITDIVLHIEQEAIAIYGTVNDETKVSSYELYLKKVADGTSETLISSGESAITEGILGNIDTDSLESGEYNLRLVVVDASNNISETQASFTFQRGNNGGSDIDVEEDLTAPIILTELKAEIKNGSLEFKINGTIDDEHLSSYDVVTGRLNPEGEITSGRIIASGTESVIDTVIGAYTYEQYEIGDYGVSITAVDEAGNLRTLRYKITINSKGVIDHGYHGEEDDEEEEDLEKLLNLTLSKSIADVGESVNAYVAYPKNATSVRLTANGTEVNLAGRTATISSDVAGEIQVVLQATIGEEEKTITKMVRFFDRTDHLAPVVEFITPEADSDVKIKTDIIANIYDETSLAYYVLEYRMDGVDSDYIELARGTNEILGGKVGELDTTMLMNGSYLLRITAVDNGGNRIWVERTVNVTGNLKVGNMSLGFTDINSNVAGIPMTVNRYYDSRNKVSGDFGYGWTMGIESAKIVESNPITEGYGLVQKGERFSTSYYMEQTKCHDVTVVYGDGTSDKFELKLTPERSALIPIYEVKVYFICVTDNKVKLELVGNNKALVSGDELVFEDSDMFEEHDYLLTRADGTKLYLSTDYGLTKMEDANGNAILINKSGYKHTSGNSVLFTRDVKGRITKVEEKNSDTEVINEVYYVYDNKGDLVSVTDYANRTVSFTYDSDHNLVDIIDPSGIAVARNIYDEDGRLIATVDANGNRIEYEHDLDAKMEVVRDKMGNATVYYYDDNGNVLRTVDALGNATEKIYDENNNVTLKIDQKGYCERYVYDDNGYLEQYIDKNGNAILYEYNNYGQITKQINPDDTINQFEYDSKGNLISESDKEGNSIAYKYDAVGNVSQEIATNGLNIKYEYDSSGNLSRYNDGINNITSYEYDEKNNLVRELLQYSDNKNESETVYEYDMYGNKVAMYRNGVLINRYIYDISGKVISEADNDTTVQFEYDNSGNIKRVMYSDGSSEEFAYDKNGNKILYIDKNGNETRYEYDKLGRNTQIYYWDGSNEEFAYNERGELIRYKNKLGLIENYMYDANGNNIEISNNVSGTKTYSYDNMNRVISSVDENGMELQFEYDRNGNRTKEIYPDNTFELYEYDSCMNKTSYTDREGNEYKYSYDLCGNLISVTDSNMCLTKYEYDCRGNKISEIDANNNKTIFQYDVNGNVIGKKLPNGQRCVYGYDDYNRLNYEIDYNGNRIDYSYYDNGKIALIKSQSGEFKRYEYYQDGSVKKIITENGEEFYVWENGKLISRTDENGEKIEYSYDVNGNITEIISPEGKMCYKYDLLSRLINVVDFSGNACNYEYDNVGNLKKESLANGVETEFVYNDISELINVTTKNKNEEVISSFAYELGANGERIKTTDNEGNINEYKYDNQYQLIEEKHISVDGNIKVIGYNYDSVGNRIEKNENGIITNYVYDNNNQLIQEGDIRYRYDANGNLIKKENGNDIVHFDYNSYNQLIGIKDNDEVVVNYKYDSQGNRISKITSETRNTYVVDINREVSQIHTKKTFQNENISVENYIYGDKLIGQEMADQTLYYLIDGQLNIRGLLNSDGNVVENYDYDSFGNIISTDGDIGCEFGYTSQQYDHDAEMYYLRARYMNPTNGRFITRDSYCGDVFEPKTLHKYTYVSNDPVNNYDPLGLWMQKVIQGILAHRFINIKYIEENKGHIVNADRKNAHISGMVNGAAQHKYIDIIDYTSSEIYEIKPYDGVVDGLAQVKGYLDMINTNDQKGEYFTKGQKFRLGNSWPIPVRIYPWPLGGAICVYLKYPGLICYFVARNEIDEYDNAYAWNMLKRPEFNVGYVEQFEVVAMLAASIPAIVCLVNKARMVDLTCSLII